MTSKIVGLHEVTCDLSGSPQVLEFVSLDGGKSSLLVSEGVRVADGVDAHELTLMLRDDEGRMVSGETDNHIRVLFEPSVADSVLGAFVETEDGVYTAQVTSLVVGDHEASARGFAPQKVSFVAPDESANEAVLPPLDDARLSNTGSQSLDNMFVALFTTVAGLLLVGVSKRRRRATRKH